MGKRASNQAEAVNGFRARVLLGILYYLPIDGSMQIRYTYRVILYISLRDVTSYAWSDFP
jgi:hypothetical protein